MHSLTVRRTLTNLRSMAILGRDRWDAAVLRRLARAVSGDDQATIVNSHRTRGGVVILRLQARGIGPGVLKVTRTPSAAIMLARERAALGALTEAAPARLRQRLPDILAAGKLEGWSYLLQRWIPGEPASVLRPRSTDDDRLVVVAAAFAREIHRLEAEERTITAMELQAWVDEPIRVVSSVIGPEPALADLAERIPADMPGRATTGWIHGDFWSDNILVDAATGEINGVVDWDSAGPAALALHDLLHLVLYARKRRRRTEIGDEICRVLRDEPQWTAAEREVVESALRAGREQAPFSIRTAIAMYWLRLISMNLERRPRLARQRRWVEDNVRKVLECL